MKYSNYPSYKDSGVEWLGSIPEHWDTSRLKYLCRITTGGKDTENKVDNGVYPFYVRSQTVERINSYSYDGEAILTAGDGVGVGKVFHYVEGKFDFHQRVYMFYKFKQVEGRFLFQYIKNNFYKVALAGVSKSTVDSLRLPLIQNFMIAVPPLQEQQAITNYLDKVTAKMDALIEKQTKLIELLKEKRQAIISTAVTRGLDNTVDMKDSGVVWLGEIPEGWKVTKLRYIFSFGKGLTITKANLVDEGIPCVNYGEVHSKYGFEVDADKHPLKCVDRSYLADSKSSFLSIGDFVFADTSEDLEGAGNFTHVSSEAEMFAGYHTIIARQIDNNSYRFLAYLIDSQVFRNQIRLSVKGVKVFSITQAILRASISWLPDLKEQQTIANYLDDKTSKIDSLIAKATKAIELLKEKRTALISATVTGKIDVREAA